MPEQPMASLDDPAYSRAITSSPLHRPPPSTRRAAIPSHQTPLIGPTHAPPELIEIERTSEFWSRRKVPDVEGPVTLL